MSDESLEYKVDKSLWRVDDFRSLSRDMGVIKSHIAKFHWWAENQPHLDMGWKGVRMLYGIDPMIPESVKADHFGMIYTLEEIAEKIPIDLESLEMELDLIRTAWMKYSRTIPIDEPKEVAVSDQQAIMPAFDEASFSTDPLTDDQRNYVRSRGFTLDMFEYQLYDEEQRNTEMRWFYERLVELKKVFDEPMAKTLARQAIIKELTLRRFDEALIRETITSPKFRVLNKDKQEMEESYSAQWAQIEEMCPYVKGSIGKVTTFGVFSDIIKGHQEFFANQDNTTVDGLLTNYEIQIEFRQSEQAGVRYRPGLIAAINEARAGLFDPSFQRTIPNSTCRALDLAFAKAMEYMNEKSGVKLTDLLKDGPEGEYPLINLAEAAEIGEIDLSEGEQKKEEHGDEPIIAPDESVEMDSMPDQNESR